MSETPLVSIFMNCYNGEKYLRYALDSVLEQTYQNWELIFWDNRSTDKSGEIFKSYDDRRFKYYFAPKHTLLYEAKNYAIKKGSGEFYAFLDVDDWWDKGKLLKQLQLFEDPRVGIVYGNYWFVNERKGKRKILYNKQLPSGRILNELLQHYVVGLLTIVIRSSAFTSLDHPFDPRFQVIGDFDLVVRLAETWMFECVQSPVAYYRWHGSNISSTQKERNLCETEIWIHEMRESSIKSSQKGFKKNEELYLYKKAMIRIEQKKMKEALRIFWRIPFGIEKLKLLTAFILPNFVLSRLRT
jgi:glycosyltransferase involved in cell wall biosynthesis